MPFLCICILQIKFFLYLCRIKKIVKNTNIKFSRMKIIVRAMFLLLYVATLASCFKDEPLNSEADIENVSVSVDNPGDYFYSIADSQQSVISTNNTVVFHVKRKADLSAVAVRFKLSEGATVSPENGSVHDFSNGPVAYTVTSQDGDWKRIYNVSFDASPLMVNDTLKCDFEEYYLDSIGEGAPKYYAWNFRQENGSLTKDWATGNVGFSITAYGQPAEAFPSVMLPNGYDGAAVKLETKSTGALGAMMQMGIAAGNLFLGSFDMENAVMDPLHATLMGKPFTRKPIKFTGYYKYAPGNEFWNKDLSVDANRVDSAAVYSVLYRRHYDTEGNEVCLNGEDILSSPYIVAIADMGYVKPVSEWTAFEVEFKYLSDLNLDLLESRGYSLAIVFSSSKDGALFQGAPGSTLCIDKVRVICQKEEN